VATKTHLHFSREDLLTATEVARILRVKRTTALDYMRRGVVPACKIGRRWYSPKQLLDSHLGGLFDSNWSHSGG
jgi:excisionase family DNA binding protein